ncbi:protein of unknown function [uncultured Woeseiaceae bacterium]|uniref:Uncharacterized protein n=1 Tax=uncultured Woeseiaceae bacterium TaxID=1983305 RepID=A0A7D9D3X0_9GAMM|nr:protein of unknown function [uncultured Woeseiaceae bacterium]
MAASGGKADLKNAENQDSEGPVSARSGHSISPENDQMTGRERPVVGKRAKRPEIQGSAPDSEKIPGMLAMQSGRNSVSMAMGMMEKALYSSYTPP